MEKETKVFKMIPFKDGRTFYVNTKDIDFEKNIMSFFIFDNGALQKHKNKQFSINNEPEGDVIIPLDDVGKPMFGLFKDMIFSDVNINTQEHEMILMYIFKELTSIYNKSKNKKDFDSLLTFFKSLNLKLKE